MYLSRPPHFSTPEKTREKRGAHEMPGYTATLKFSKT